MATHDVPTLTGGKIAGTVVDLDTVEETSTRKLMSAAERTKLANLGDSSTKNVGTGSSNVAAGDAPAAAQTAAVGVAAALAIVFGA